MPEEKNTILGENTDTEVTGEGEETKATETEETPNTQETDAQKNLEDTYDKKGEDKENKPEKADDDAKKDEKETEDKESVVEYEEFTLPEGMEADDSTMESFKSIAGESKLSQEQAQKLVDLGSDLIKKQQDSLMESHSKQVEEWTKQAESDEELKTDFKEKVGLANKALKEFGSSDLVKTLEDTGMSNHPEVVKAFYRIGKAMSEDNFVEGKRGDPTEGMSPTEKLEQLYKK